MDTIKQSGTGWVGYIMTDNVFQIIPNKHERLLALITAAQWALDNYGDMQITLHGQLFENMRIYVNSSADNVKYFDISGKVEEN